LVRKLTILAIVYSQIRVQIYNWLGTSPHISYF